MTLFKPSKVTSAFIHVFLFFAGLNNSSLLCASDPQRHGLIEPNSDLKDFLSFPPRRNSFVFEFDENIKCACLIRFLLKVCLCSIQLS